MNEAYVMLAATCFGCKQLFISNPTKVPSYENHPVCRDCMEVVNKEREENGREPFPIHPNAYGPCNEYELN